MNKIVTNSNKSIRSQLPENFYRWTMIDNDYVYYQFIFRKSKLIYFQKNRIDTPRKVFS